MIKLLIIHCLADYNKKKKKLKRLDRESLPENLQQNGLTTAMVFID